MAYQVEEAKKLIIEAGIRLLNEGLIVRTWGNISARISDTQFAITPSGKGYEGLTPDDIVVVDIKKLTYEGDIKPSSECGVHADVYAKRPEVNFVVHTHQVYASAVSILGQDVELSEEEKAFLGDRIPCAEYGMSSSPKLRKQVKKCLKKSVGCSSMLLKNHGVLCMGTDFENAFDISSMMEQVCKYKYEKLITGFAVKEEETISDEGDYISETSVNEESTEELSQSSQRAEDLSQSSEIEEDLSQSVEEAEEIDATEQDLMPGGYVDYGTSHIDGDTITLSLGDKEYTYSISDKKPISKGFFGRGKNKVALIHSRIYEDRSIAGICHVTLPNIVDVSSKLTKGFTPYIDDQAQIVGANVRCAGKIGKKPHFESASTIAKALKGNNAVLIAGQGALCVGKSEEDIEATAYVLEKGCMAAKLASCQPEAAAVPKRIAKKERAFYLDTYSKLK